MSGWQNGQMEGRTVAFGNKDIINTLLLVPIQ